MLAVAADTLVIYRRRQPDTSPPARPRHLSARTGIVIQRESGASLEHVRKITELHRVPDCCSSPTPKSFRSSSFRRTRRWYAEFARNRMVVAYTDRSKHAGEITPANWTDDPASAPTSRSAAPIRISRRSAIERCCMFQLAERFYRQPGLAEVAARRTRPTRNIRPNAAELAALLAAGELDYIYDYQSVAESNGFRFVALPPAIDLGDPTRAKEYATAHRCACAAPHAGTTTTIDGPADSVRIERSRRARRIARGASDSWRT